MLKKDVNAMSKPKKCKNYDKECGCVGCYGMGLDSCKGYNTDCYDYEESK